MTVDIFCSIRGVGHTHVVSLYDPARHRVNIDSRRYWIGEGVSLTAAAVAACEGRLKPVRAFPHSTDRSLA